MNIGDVCTREVVLIHHAASVQEAAALMRERHVGTLLVTGASPEGTQRVVGIVTDRDLAIEALARALDPQTPVARLASANLAALPAGASIDEAISVMRERGVRRLLVSAEGRELFGLVSLDDLLGALGHEVAELAHAVRKGVERETAEREPLPAAAPQKLQIPLQAFA